MVKSMRTRFDEQLRQLNVELIRMGSLCEEAISIAAKVLEGEKNISNERVFAIEGEIDQLEHDIERAAVSMVTESVEAFVQGDLKMACKVVQDDDKVDELFLKVRAELIGCLKEEVGDPEAILDLLMIAKYFERIGDHAVNVAEWVEYSITGIHESNEHHPQNVL